MFKIFFVSLLCILCQCSWQFAFSQAPHCHTTEHFDALYPENSPYRKLVEKYRHTTNTMKSQMEGDVYTIPVVVHILYNNDSENLADDRIYSQINALNEDYRRLNADTSETPEAFADVVADVEIEFCLAIIDPQGDSTTGITRTFTEVTEFDYGTNDMKRTSDGGIDAWDADSYLNIWVCDLQDDILGFSSLPGFADEDDGVVINYKFFGDGFGAVSPYNLGRTTTHEVGHYLGLSHIWGDDGDACSGSDLIADTPNQAGENYGCPAFPLTDDCTIDPPGVMFMNYMDYTNDACMNLFTEGQKTKMRIILETVRSSLLFSAAGCNEIVPVPGAIAELNVNPNPTNGLFTISIINFEGTELQLTIYNAHGQIIEHRAEEPVVVANEYFELETLPDGMYFVSAFNGTYTLTAKFIKN